MNSRIRNGMTVQMISTVVFSWNWTAWWPIDFRWWYSDQNIVPNTPMKMTTQIQKIRWCRLMMSVAIGVAGGWKFHSHAANAPPDANNENRTAKPTHRRTASPIRLPMLSPITMRRFWRPRSPWHAGIARGKNARQRRRARCRRQMLARIEWSSPHETELVEHVGTETRRRLTRD